MATLIRLSLTARQTEAVAKGLEYLRDRRAPLPSVDDLAALREVAEKLAVLRET